MATVSISLLRGDIIFYIDLSDVPLPSHCGPVLPCVYN